MPKELAIYESETDMSHYKPSVGSPGLNGITHVAWILSSFILVILFSSCPAFGDSSLSPAQEAFLKKLDQPIILRGDFFRAALVVYQDFSKTLIENAAAAKSGATTNSELASWLSRIEHYDFHIELDKTSYIVQIGPTVRDDALTVLGGGARYVIDRQTFTITNKVLLK
jgi:hypothetical protein